MPQHTTVEIQNKGVVVCIAGLRTHPGRDDVKQKCRLFSTVTPWIQLSRRQNPLLHNQCEDRGGRDGFLLYVGDAGNTLLVDSGIPLGTTAVVTPGSGGYLLWECCILQYCNVVWPHQ